jgi:hypothetical protein
MPIAIEVTLIVVLVALTIGLLGLMFQLGRTAQGLDGFLLSSKRDLSQIAEDVHASRMRMDHLAVSLQASLDELSGLARTVGDLGRTVKELHTRFECSLESASRNTAIILGGLSAVLDFFKSRQTHQQHKQEQSP